MRFVRALRVTLGAACCVSSTLLLACGSTPTDDAETPPADAPGSPSDSDAESPRPPAPPPDGGATDADACAPPNPGTAGDGDGNIGPSYADAPELTPNAGVPRGTVVTFTMSSTTSKIYPGLNGPYTRKVWVYVPKQYVDGTAAPLLVVQDGGSYVSTVPPVLDSLIAAKRVPPMIAVLVNSGGGDGRGSERGLEYDRVSPDYARFVETELLPAVLTNADLRKTYKNLKITSDPERRAAMGGSSGGAAAFTMAWFRPDLYHRVLTYSGTYVNQYPEPAHPHGAWEYHESLIPTNAAKPLRVYLEVGENDNNLDAKYGDMMHDWVKANRSMAAVLKAKGYHYRFEFAAAAGHVDGRVVRQTLPEALAWLWRGYPTCP